MKTIDWTKPIRFKLSKKEVRLIAHSNIDGKEVYVIGSTQSNKRIVTYLMNENGNLFSSGRPSSLDIENVPEQKRIPLTYEDCKNGIIVRSKTEKMVWIPHYICEDGVAMVSNDKGVIIDTFERLAKNDDLEYRTFLSPIWKPCHKTITIDTDKDEDEDEGFD